MKILPSPFKSAKGEAEYMAAYDPACASGPCLTKRWIRGTVLPVRTLSLAVPRTRRHHHVSHLLGASGISSGRGD